VLIYKFLGKDARSAASQLQSRRGGVVAVERGAGQTCMGLPWSYDGRQRCLDLLFRPRKYRREGSVASPVHRSTVLLVNSFVDLPCTVKQKERRRLMGYSRNRSPSRG